VRTTLIVPSDNTNVTNLSVPQIAGATATSAPNHASDTLD